MTPHTTLCARPGLTESFPDRRIGPRYEVVNILILSVHTDYVCQISQDGHIYLLFIKTYSYRVSTIQ